MDHHVAWLLILNKKHKEKHGYLPGGICLSKTIMWGKPSFIYTDKVAYQHKVYEFSIPLSELGVSSGDEDKDLLIAFSAYGTAGPLGEFNPTIAYDPGSGNYFLAYSYSTWPPDDSIYGHIIKSGGTVETTTTICDALGD